ncbi:peptide/nickel transport system substrate-binding protein [Nakamurella sp. UYEF19]|uniref:ABC transporter substrate-binding protein n=1 Tax=Nakamurella sp. UYEF19 TaxID=1756392 RepID=UPI003396AF17
MTRKRAVTLTALVATSALLFAACTSSPGQATSTTPTTAGSSAAPATSGAPSSSATNSGTVSSGPASSGPATSGATGSSAPTTSNEPAGADGCGKPHGAYTDPGTAAGAVTVGFNELSTSWNAQSSHGNSVYNSNALYLTQAQNWYYDKDLKLINNDSFMTCKVTSTKPLTIAYTINKDAKWSDGVPVSAEDLLMTWISNSGNFSTGEVKTDKDGNPLPSTGSTVAFDSSSPGLALIKAFPTISADHKTLTTVFTEPFVDYQLNLTIGVPAHAVAVKALGISDPTAAVAALVKAAQTKDNASLAKIANTWNTAFDFTALPSDKSLYLSDGPYIMSDFKANQFQTFTINPAYTWGPKPSVATITIQYAPDPTAAVQSLANGELQIINPQATADVLKGATALESQGVKVINGSGGTYEHVDLAENNKGPFDPATYGGDATKATEVRTAFLKTIPRQDIIDRLIKPLNPAATIRNSFTQVPGAPGYAPMVAANGMSAYDKVDLAGAKALLAQAGVKTPVNVRFMYADNNPRRASEYQLIAASAKQAGFNVIDAKNANWSSQLTNTKIYDAVLFGWQNSTTGVAQNPPNFLSGAAGQNNFYGYKNANVDKWMNQLNVTTDAATQTKLLTDTETQLVKDGFGTILFQFPDITAFDSTKVTGVGGIALVPGVFSNFWEWKIAG